MHTSMKAFQGTEHLRQADSAKQDSCKVVRTDAFYMFHIEGDRLGVREHSL